MKATAIWTAAYHINRVHGWLRRCGISRCMADEIGRDLHDKHILSPAQLRQIKDFWRPYWKVNPLFFKFYTEKYGQFSPEFIPDDLYLNIIEPRLNNHERAGALDDKGLYPVFLKDLGFRLAPTICRRTERYYFDADGNPVGADDALNLIIDAGKAFVKKSRNTSGGEGVVPYDAAGMSPDGLRNAVRRLGADWVAQAPVVQCDELNRLNPNSVNTLRIMSYLRRDGSVVVLPAAIRMSCNNARIDNGSAGGISCGILPDGRLKPTATTIHGDKCDVHPLTGVRFDDVTVPDFSRIVERVRYAHPRFPFLRLMAWDIAVDSDREPVLIEFNYNGGLQITQLNNGPLFGEHSREILDDVFEIRH